MNQPSVKKNFVYKIVYEILAIIIPMITTPYVSRVLGGDGIGIYSYTSSIMTYFTLFAALGTANYGTREIAQHRDSKGNTSQLFWEIELMTIISSTICLMGWGVLVAISTTYKFYFMALTPCLLATMADISWFYTGLEKVKYTIIWNSICKILGVVLLFCFVRSKDDLPLYFIINSWIQLLGNISMWIYLPKFLSAINLKKLHIRSHFKQTLIYFVPSIAISIYTVLDKTLIGILTEDAFENGYYEQGSKIIGIIKVFVYAALNSVVGARMSYLFAQKKYEEVYKRIEQSIDFILFLGFACSFGLVCISNEFVPLFFGKGFEQVVEILYFMSSLIVIISISNCIGNQYLVPSGRIKEAGIIVSIGAVINFFCNIILIPKAGAVGATIGSIIAETFITLAYMYCAKNFLAISYWIKVSWKRILAGLSMCISIHFLKRGINFSSLFLSVSWQILVGAVIYIIVLDLLQDQLLLWLKEKMKISIQSIFERR